MSKEFKNELVINIKENFNLKDEKNVGKIACFIIGYDVNRKLTNNEAAFLIIELKNEVGLKCNCSGSCIAWYRNKLIKGKLIKIETAEEKEIRLKKEMRALIKKRNEAERARLELTKKARKESMKKYNDKNKYKKEWDKYNKELEELDKLDEELRIKGENELLMFS